MTRLLIVNWMSRLGLVTLVPAALSAQTSTPSALTAAADSTPVVQQGSVVVPLHRGLFGRQDAYLATGFALAATALFPFDQQIAAHLQSPAIQGTRGFDGTATTLEKLTSPGAYYIGGSLYLVGRLGGFERIADLGLHATESVLLAEGIGFVLKRGIGRARPYVSGATDARDFSIGSGMGTG
ncbi:MAG TPA: hypothetical protein VEB19_14140, partial [Gemmatimonadaceae bacterium]|nr:hypothetical protein [Gemmatimonadaceae bacterium]